MKAADDESSELKPFLEHLEDFRRMIIRCAAALAAGTLVAIPLVPGILGLLKAPLARVTEQPDRFLQTMEVTGAFSATMKMALWCGLLLSAPFLLLFIGAFVLPALTRREQRLALRAGLFAVALFAFGVALAYHFTLPFALKAMFGVNTWLGIQANWTLTSYVSFASQLLIAFGLAFEMPVALLVLGRLGILSAAQLSGKRRHAILAILVIGAVLTPPDVVSQMIMSVPLYLLFELCIWIIRFWEKDGANTNKIVAGSDPSATGH
jgi:sec-independent protein translocase protein TatC